MATADLNSTERHHVREKRATGLSNITLEFLGGYLLFFASIETGINTPQSHVIYLLNNLMTS